MHGEAWLVNAHELCFEERHASRDSSRGALLDADNFIHSVFLPVETIERISFFETLNSSRVHLIECRLVLLRLKEKKELCARSIGILWFDT